MTDATGLILLAAGGSTRLGQPKQLLSYQGRTLLSHATETALGSVCRPVVVVLGANASLLRDEVAGLSVLIAENSDWEKGMGSSIRAGLAILETTAPKLVGVVLMLCDQPLITSNALNALVRAYQDTGSPLIVSEYAGTRGAPAFFSHALFPELRTLPESQGAKPIIARHAAEAVCVPVPAATMDIDTAADYEQLIVAQQA